MKRAAKVSSSQQNNICAINGCDIENGGSPHEMDSSELEIECVTNVWLASTSKSGNQLFSFFTVFRAI